MTEWENPVVIPVPADAHPNVVGYFVDRLRDRINGIDPEEGDGLGSDGNVFGPVPPPGEEDIPRNERPAKRDQPPVAVAVPESPPCKLPRNAPRVLYAGNRRILWLDPGHAFMDHRPRLRRVTEKLLQLIKEDGIGGPQVYLTDSIKHGEPWRDAPDIIID